MKKYLIVLVATVQALVGCTNQQFLEDGLTNQFPVVNGDFYALIEQARGGDGGAFLQLADCYRDGKGVEKDLVGMLAMVAQAEEFGGINRMEDYLENLPKGTDFRLICDAIAKVDARKADDAKAMTEQLLASGSSEGYTVQGIIAVESGDTLAGLQLMEQAASQGSTLADLLLCLPDWHEKKMLNVERLTALSNKIPFVNNILARMYMGNEEEGLRDENLAAYYFLRADESACLDRRGARWLLNYHQNVSPLSISERDVQRLEMLARRAHSNIRPTVEYEDDSNDDVVVEEVVDTMVVIDSW